jgi:hypothetical protein
MAILFWIGSLLIFISFISFLCLFFWQTNMNMRKFCIITTSIVLAIGTGLSCIACAAVQFMFL